MKDKHVKAKDDKTVTAVAHNIQIFKFTNVIF